MTVRNIIRPEVRQLRPYEAAGQIDDFIRLNANEASWCSDDIGELNRYPEVRPTQLRDAMSAHFGVGSDCLLVTRGSSEAIDIITRTFCRPGVDNIVLSAPTFGMYQVYAELQGAQVIKVPTRIEDDYSIDVEQLISAANDQSKIVYICSPNNPTGRSVNRADMERLLDARQGASVIVVDEAYIEFSDLESVCEMTDTFENLIVLRTTSKALALAGARCGCAIANREVIEILDSVLPPYSTPTPVSSRVAAALAPNRISENQLMVENTRKLRAYLSEELRKLPVVERVISSDANFLLARFVDAARAFRACMEAGILLRDLSAVDGLENCLRISIGSEREIEHLLSSLRRLEQ